MVQLEKNAKTGENKTKNIHNYHKYTWFSDKNKENNPK